jgi:hypothetical protein
MRRHMSVISRKMASKNSNTMTGLFVTAAAGVAVGVAGTTVVNVFNSMNAFNRAAAQLKFAYHDTETAEREKCIAHLEQVLEECKKYALLPRRSASASRLTAHPGAGRDERVAEAAPGATPGATYAAMPAGTPIDSGRQPTMRGGAVAADGGGGGERVDAVRDGGN